MFFLVFYVVKLRMYVYLWLVPHPTVFITHLWIHGMCAYVYTTGQLDTTAHNATARGWPSQLWMEAELQYVVGLKKENAHLTTCSIHRRMAAALQLAHLDCLYLVHYEIYCTSKVECSTRTNHNHTRVPQPRHRVSNMLWQGSCALWAVGASRTRPHLPPSPWRAYFKLSLSIRAGTTWPLVTNLGYGMAAAPQILQNWNLINTIL
jgi:hypothetical protein